ncbi:lipid-A-disaccharide synthase [Candidatus Omnitrophota bacterium]
MEEKIKKIAIVAGEASSDMHAAHLVEALKKQSPHIEFFGLGGKKMQAAGVLIFYNLVDLAVVGFFEVLKNYSTFKKIFNDFLKEIDEIKPDCVILIDYPGFNMRLAKELKKREIRVIYYISPQVWAWGKERIALIKKYVDKMIVIFKFEEELYQQHGINVSFVGHPLMESIKVTTEKEQFLKRAGLSEKNITIGLLPGSRQREIKALLPAMLKAASIISQKMKNAQFIVLQSPTLPDELVKIHTSGYNLPLRIIRDDTYNGINASDIVISASGTATLETAILKKPLIVVYKVSFLTWLIAKSIIKLPYIGLVNVVAQKKLMPELIQYQATAENIADEAMRLISDKHGIKTIKKELDSLQDSLGKPGASQRAAQIIAGLV